MPTLKRCAWPGSDALYCAYHDEEWGVPLHDDRALFEFLVLEGAQAGLSWSTILNKRENYRAAFDRFDPRKVARYDGRRVAALLRNAGIVRNRLKIESAIKNARGVLALKEEFGTRLIRVACVRSLPGEAAASTRRSCAWTTTRPWNGTARTSLTCDLTCPWWS